MAADREHFAPGPPPVVCSERVLQYAVLDDTVRYNSSHGLFFVGGKELGKVPCLAICEEKGTSQVLLYHCESDWSPLGLSEHDSVAAAKTRAERIYPGSSAKWIETHFTKEDAAHFLDEIWADDRCSFCGKRPDENIELLFKANANARICEQCVRRFYAEMDSPSKKD